MHTLSKARTLAEIAVVPGSGKGPLTMAPTE